MTYIQLSLYGIPAVVLHRNSLTLETWSTWYTPVYILDDWAGRQRMEQVAGLVCGMTKNPVKEPQNVAKIQKIVQAVPKSDKPEQAVQQYEKPLPAAFVEELSLF